MNLKNAETQKRPFDSERPFPWRCRNCGRNEVVPTSLPYDAEVHYDGRLYEINIPNLELPVCRACGEKVFTEFVDDQINRALRSQLHLLTPQEMYAALDRLGMSPQEAADRLGISEEILNYWLTETQIQPRAMDNLLRVFFEFPQVRAALAKGGFDSQMDAVALGVS
jgi:DNA-binding transcriptional regulator YiaG